MFHIAKLYPNYIDAIFSGRKTMDSRFSENRIVPYGRIGKGEIVYMKETSGPIRGRAAVGEVYEFSNITPNLLAQLKSTYDKFLLAGDEYWRIKTSARYGVIVKFENVHQLPPFSIHVNNRSGWLCYPNPQIEFFTQPNQIVIGLAGEIACGKTTIARYIQNKWGFQHCVFSDFLRSRLMCLGVEPTRNNLQSYGEGLYSELGGEKFCEAFLDHFSGLSQKDSIVDGIRRLETYKCLKKRYGGQFYFIYLSADKPTRYNRFLGRGDLNNGCDFTSIAYQNSEIEINSLRTYADCILDVNKDLDTVLQILDEVLFVNLELIWARKAIN
jgi:dephospho-CoA kinase